MTPKELCSKYGEALAAVEDYLESLSVVGQRRKRRRSWRKLANFLGKAVSDFPVEELGDRDRDTVSVFLTEQAARFRSGK